MNLEEIKEAKAHAESKIGDIIKELEKKTGCQFESIDMTSFEHQMGRDYLFYIRLYVPHSY